MVTDRSTFEFMRSLLILLVLYFTRATVFCMAKRDSDESSFSDEEGLAIPKRLFPSEITEMLFASEVKTDLGPEIVENHSPFDSEMMLVGGTEHSGDDIAFCESPVGQSEGQSEQCTATEVCQLLMDSSYETSADEQTSMSTSSSDSVFDLSDPDAKMAECSDQDSDGDADSNHIYEASCGGQPDTYVNSDSDNESSSSSEVISKHKLTASKSTKSAASKSTRSSALIRAKTSVARSAKLSASKQAKSSAKKKSGSKSREQESDEFSTHNISEEDEASEGYTEFPFLPCRNVGVCLPPGKSDTTPKGLFQLYFTDSVVDDICSCSNEYAELMKHKKPSMYSTYKEMNPEDFLKMVGMLIHFGYRKLPQYKLAWRRQSLCYDPFIASTMGRNRFHSLMSFLHLVDKSTEDKLKDEGDKLVKVYPILPM